MSTADFSGDLVSGRSTLSEDLEALLPFDLVSGERLDRYHILELVGAGAIGSVYAAYDPKLDRRIALKVLRRGGDDVEARMLREARALARVRSPHVVAVHDAGAEGNRLFVAMELVDGVTLREWLKARPRGVAEILAVFLQAGRGLAAAHAAGIVHRDFKPDNVLVGPGDHAMVTDFGLARLAAERVASAATGAVERDPHLTSTGALVGTPAYMAPEQLRGEGTDARSDLFSFCVALHAALHGHHPFPMESMTKLNEAVLAGVILPGTNPAVPARVRDAVLAGLRSRREERPASMDELLRRLEPRPARRAGFVTGAVALVAIGAAALAARPRPAVEPPCRGAGRRLAGVWDEERRETVRRALAATGSAYAAEAARGIERALDAYATRWIVARTDACQATHVRGEQSEAALDLRMGCLDERLGGVAALVRSIERAGAAQVPGAVVAAYSLPALDRCADARALVDGAPPVAPARGPLLALARATLAQAGARLQLGDQAEGLRAVGAVLAVAESTGDRRLEAEARLVDGQLRATSDPKAAEVSFRAGAVAALASGRPDLAARAWQNLARRLGVERNPEALGLTELALAASRRAGDETLRAEVLVARGAVHGNAHRFDLALPVFREALSLQEARLGPDSLGTVDALRGLAWAQRNSARPDAAVALVEKAAAISARTLGRDHPSALTMRSQVGCTLIEAGRFGDAIAALTEVVAARDRLGLPEDLGLAGTLDCLGLVQHNTSAHPDAIRTYRRSLALMEAAYGKDSPRLVYDLGMMARSLAWVGEAQAADAAARRAVAIAAALPDDSALQAVVRLHHSAVLWRAGRCREALPLAEEARARFASQHSESGDYDATYAMDTVARCQAMLGRKPEAEATFQASLAMREKAFGGDHVSIAEGLLGLSELYLGSGDQRRAQVAAERALGILERGSATGAAVGEARLRVAAALWPVDQGRARELGRRAVADLAAAPAEELTRREAEAWVAAHP